MSMNLSSDDLETIAEKVSNLAAIEGTVIREIKVRGHVIFLQKTNDDYEVVGITNKDPKSPGSPTMRGDRT